MSYTYEAHVSLSPKNKASFRNPSFHAFFSSQKSELKQMRRITLIVQEIRELEEFMQNKHVQQFDIVWLLLGAK